jgi:hypothetical protein
MDYRSGRLWPKVRPDPFRDLAEDYRNNFFADKKVPGELHLGFFGGTAATIFFFAGGRENRSGEIAPRIILGAVGAHLNPTVGGEFRWEVPWVANTVLLLRPERATRARETRFCASTYSSAPIASWSHYRKRREVRAQALEFGGASCALEDPGEGAGIAPAAPIVIASP